MIKGDICYYISQYSVISGTVLNDNIEKGVYEVEQSNTKIIDDILYKDISFSHRGASLVLSHMIRKKHKKDMMSLKNIMKDNPIAVLDYIETLHNINIQKE